MWKVHNTVQITFHYAKYTALLKAHCSKPTESGTYYTVANFALSCALPCMLHCEKFYYIVLSTIFKVNIVYFTPVACAVPTFIHSVYPIAVCTFQCTVHTAPHAGADHKNAKFLDTGKCASECVQ